MGQQVDREVTHVSEEQAEIYLSIALTLALGQTPPESLAIYCLALAWVETGDGDVVCNNPGNLFARGYAPGNPLEIDYWGGDYWRPSWIDEHSNDDAVFAGKVPSAFRAYADPQEGWNAFARTVVAKKPLVAAMVADDPLLVVRALKSTGYSPDYSDSHADTFRSLAHQLRDEKRFAGFSGVTLPGYTAPAGAPAQTASRRSAPGGAAPMVIFAGITVALLLLVLRVKPGSRSLRRLAA
jgi:hypothetical protein